MTPCGRRIANDTQGLRRGTCRATMLDPYLPFIRDTLAQYPRLRATRLFEMVKGRSYTGSVVQLRRAVRLIRPAGGRARQSPAHHARRRGGPGRLGRLWIDSGSAAACARCPGL